MPVISFSKLQNSEAELLRAGRCLWLMHESSKLELNISRKNIALRHRHSVTYKNANAMLWYQKL